MKQTQNRVREKRPERREERRVGESTPAGGADQEPGGGESLLTFSQLFQFFYGFCFFECPILGYSRRQ